MDGCPVKYALGILQGRWKFQVLWELAHVDSVRFNELQRRVDGISSLMLSKTLKELVDYAKANPGKLNAGVPGVGTTAHITLEAFMAETGARMTVVPYRSEPQMLTDLVGGQLDFACTLTTSPGPHVQAGRLRALAVTSATRTQQLPDVSTVEQAGFPGFEATAWFALAVPTGTPADIIAKINAAANAFIRSAKGREELNKLDSLPAGGTPAETKAFIAAEVRKWAPIIRAAKIQM